LKAEPEVVDLGAELVPEALFRVAEPELFVGEAPPVEGEPEPEGALVPTAAQACIWSAMAFVARSGQSRMMQAPAAVWKSGLVQTQVMLV